MNVAASTVMHDHVAASTLRHDHNVALCQETALKTEARDRGRSRRAEARDRGRSRRAEARDRAVDQGGRKYLLLLLELDGRAGRLRRLGESRHLVVKRHVVQLNDSGGGGGDGGHLRRHVLRQLGSHWRHLRARARHVSKCYRECDLMSY